jgi:hypothetical protein
VLKRVGVTQGRQNKKKKEELGILSSEQQLATSVAAPRVKSELKKEKKNGEKKMYEGNGRSVRVGSHFDCIRESYCK